MNTACNRMKRRFTDRTQTTLKLTVLLTLFYAAAGLLAQEVKYNHVQLIHHPGTHLHQAVAVPQQLPKVAVLCIRQSRCAGNDLPSSAATTVAHLVDRSSVS